MGRSSQHPGASAAPEAGGHRVGRSRRHLGDALVGEHDPSPSEQPVSPGALDLRESFPLRGHAQPLRPRPWASFDVCSISKIPIRNIHLIEK